VSYALTIAIHPDLADALSSKLFDAGIDGLEQRDGVEQVELVIYAENRVNIESIEAMTRAWLTSVGSDDARALAASLDVQPIDDTSWKTKWTEYLTPVLVTDDVVVQPAWDATAPPPGARQLVIDPALCFGDGSHATTRLCARSVQRYCRSHPGCSVLDVGTGTGILTLVAVLEGAARALGIDVDAVAVAAATRNALLNRLEDRCSFSTEPLETIEQEFDLVVANIGVRTLMALSVGLARCTAPSGRLCVSGFVEADRDELCASFRAVGFSRTQAVCADDWVLLEIER
jgi:ribosomal protein L11 methyltransferase